ncbi:hypothetical protein DFH09DRAFT_1353766 [Mycena vulgaris]|nr:hypothetical protein DFH09DRAFT_1353766 [Mycena vulgaris]
MLYSLVVVPTASPFPPNPHRSHTHACLASHVRSRTTPHVLAPALYAGALASHACQHVAPARPPLVRPRPPQHVPHVPRPPQYVAHVPRTSPHTSPLAVPANEGESAQRRTSATSCARLGLKWRRGLKFRAKT